MIRNGFLNQIYRPDGEDSWSLTCFWEQKAGEKLFCFTFVCRKQTEVEMAKRYKIILFLFFIANMAFAEGGLDSLLIDLDQTILRHEIYKNRREDRIHDLKEKVAMAVPGTIAAYQLNDCIYREYKSYMCDSAVLYLTKFA